MSLTMIPLASPSPVDFEKHVGLRNQGFFYVALKGKRKRHRFQMGS